MTRQRSATLTFGAATSAAVILVFLFKAPPIPVAAGVLIAAVFLLRRKARR